MASPSTIFSMLCPPCAAVPFANSTKPRDNAKNGMRFLKLAMFEFLNLGASERDCFETPHSEQISFEGLDLLRPDEVESTIKKYYPSSAVIRIFVNLKARSWRCVASGAAVLRCARLATF
jgi:hypothetical protein